MSEIIPKSQMSWGAGKGDWERPIDPKVYKENLSNVKFSGKHSGTPVRKKLGKTTYKY
jgi:hypothetical protein